MTASTSRQNGLSLAMRGGRPALFVRAPGGVLPTAVWLVVAVAGCGVALGQNAGDGSLAPASPPVPRANGGSLVPPAASSRDPAAAFADPASSVEARRAAAAALLSTAREPQIALLNRGISADDPPGSRLAAVGALLDAATPPAACVAALGEGLRNGTAAERELVIAALARYRTREAIRPLVQALTADPRPADAEQLLNALGRQTGMIELGPDPESWSVWWKEVEYLPEAEWRSRLAEAQSRRADALATEHRQLMARLDEAVRKTYSLLPTDERLPYLEALLGDASPEMRALGLDLAERRLLNNRALSEAVIAAALGELRSASSDVRVRAARIVSKLAMPEHASAVAAALTTEQSPAAAAALLQYLVSRPTPSATGDVLRWAEPASPAQASALDALAALVRSTPAPDAGLIEQVRAVVSDTPPAELSASGLELLILAEGVGSVTALLNDPSEAVVFNAADALARTGRGLGELIDAARTREALFYPTVRAIRAQMPSTDGYRCLGLLAEPATAPGAVSEAKAAFGVLLPAPDLLEVAADESDPVLRERVLEHLARPEFAAQVAADSRWWACVEALARTRLELRDAAGALDVLDALPAGAETSVAGAQRVTALVMLGRIDDAQRATEAAALGADPWLDALDRATGLAQADVIRATIDRLFGKTLTDAQIRRYESQTQMLDALALGGRFDPSALLPWVRLPSRWTRLASPKPERMEVGPPAPGTNEAGD